MAYLRQDWLVSSTLCDNLVYWVEIVRPHFAQWQKGNPARLVMSALGEEWVLMMGSAYALKEAQ